MLGCFQLEALCFKCLTNFKKKKSSPEIRLLILERGRGKEREGETLIGEKHQLGCLSWDQTSSALVYGTTLLPAEPPSRGQSYFYLFILSLSHIISWSKSQIISYYNCKSFSKYSSVPCLQFFFVWFLIILTVKDTVFLPYLRVISSKTHPHNTDAWNHRQ